MVRGIGILCLGFMVIELAAGDRRETGPFMCEYFSDGTRKCRYENALDLSSSWIDGRWEEDDGFFRGWLNTRLPKVIVGSCSFSSDGSASCTGIPTTTMDSAGNVGGKGGGLVYFPGYDGSPRGRLRAAPRIGVMPPH